MPDFGQNQKGLLRGIAKDRKEKSETLSRLLSAESTKPDLKYESARSL